MCDFHPEKLLQVMITMSNVITVHCPQMSTLHIKGKGSVQLLMEPHLTATDCHLPYVDLEVFFT